MSASVTFTPHDSTVSIEIATLDTLIASYVGTGPYGFAHPYYTAMCLFGIGAMMHHGGDSLTQDAFDAHAERCNVSAEHREVYQKFLINDFRFTAWC